MTQVLKSLTIQLPEEDWAALEREAQDLGVSVERLAKTLLLPNPKRVLTREAQLAQAKLFLEASKVFREAARQIQITEPDVVQIVRAVRKSLAEERRTAEAAAARAS